MLGNDGFRKRAWSLLLFSLVVLAAPVHSQIVYSDFSSTAGLALNGNAAQSGSLLRLTPSAGLQTGSAWYGVKQHVRYGFETLFRFQMTDPGGIGPADGLAFVIQNSPDGAAAMGGTGAHMGYGFLTNSLAVELDTYQNGSDPDGNHLGVHTRGKFSNLAHEAASIGRTSSIPTLADGNVHTLKVHYVPGTLTIYLDDLSTPALTVAYGLRQLGLDQGRAYVGFTAATGSGHQNHDILSWTFVPVTPAAVPEPGALALLGSLLVSGGLLFRRRRRSV